MKNRWTVYVVCDTGKLDPMWTEDTRVLAREYLKRIKAAHPGSKFVLKKREEDKPPIEEETIEEESACCEVCGGEAMPMGKLGRRFHYRCRDCGAEQSILDQNEIKAGEDSLANMAVGKEP